MFVDNASGFVLDDRNNNGADEKAEKGETGEGSIGKREEARVEKEGEEGGED